MINEILGDILPDLGDVPAVDPGCGCFCESGKVARNYTFADAQVTVAAN